MRKLHIVLLVAILSAAVLLSKTLRSTLPSSKQPRASGASSYFGGGAQRTAPGNDPAPEESEPQENTGALRGNVVDQNNQPVYAIGVELISLDKTHSGEEEHWEATRREWTGKNGEYEFSHLPPGEYFLSVGTDSAPTGKHPFAPAYYPGTEQQSFAEPVRVQGSLRIGLRTLRLRRLPTATIKVHVIWRDGTLVPWSNLLFHNPSFPRQGVIGDEGLGIRDGQGEVVLPLGFDYYARAAVQCDAGTQSRSEESRPVQKIAVKAGHVPTELTFVMPTEHCKLWSPPEPNNSANTTSQ